MSKPSSLWFRKQNGCWYSTVNGVQHNLGKDKAEARKQLHQLLAGDNPRPEKTGMTTRRLCDNYLTRTADGKEAQTHAVQVLHLKAFCAVFGRRDPASLKVHEVETWLAERDTWARSTKALSITILKAAFNWGEAQGYLARNPIKKLKRRATGKRDRIPTAEEWDAIKGAVSEDFRDFLEVLEFTGCRPFSEAAKLTASEIDFEQGCSVRKKHKNKKKGRDRTLYFPAKLLSRLRELAERRPTGPLLVNRFGNAWSKNNTGRYIARVAKKLGCPGITCYGARHRFCTEALLRGVPVDVLAGLVGNSPEMLRRHYSHVMQRHEAMRAAAERALG